MRDLIDNPLWRPEDLGAPIPDSPHAVSACLPTWEDNIGYEEQDPRVHQKLSTGYPRFAYNRFCRDLFAACAARFADAGEACLAFPSRAAAERFRAYVHDKAGDPARIHTFGVHNVHAVCFLKRHAGIAKDGWQHFGEGVSSRRAEACLTGRADEQSGEAKRAVRERIAHSAGASSEDVYLFSCGMSAVYAVYRVLNSMYPDRKSVQFGFPYVDTLKIQEKLGCGVHFFPRGADDELQELEDVLKREPVSGLYTEFPSNPLLTSPDVGRLADLARRYSFPFVVDDTLATFVNADLLSTADVVCTSLTKFFSGAGDVTAGSVVLSPRSSFHAELSSILKRDYEDILWGADSVVLERNSRDFDARVSKINTGAEALADYLKSHPKVSEVYYPKFQTPEAYHVFRKPRGGYGGLLSIVLADASRNTAGFYDALRICKGPNLGTNYSLVCPYTILAHYRELDWAESCGVSRYLIRISVGLEEPDELIGRFEQALSIL